MTLVAYLGHIFSANVMMPDTQKVEAVKNWEPPTTVTAVRQFIGLASYYRRCVQKILPQPHSEKCHFYMDSGMY